MVPRGPGLRAANPRGGSVGGALQLGQLALVPCPPGVEPSPVELEALAPVAGLLDQVDQPL